jgi:vanillate O-demethylase monooxygenase subunit
MFLRTCWYVAALAHEVTRFSTLARQLLGDRVVLFRTLDGEAVALEDRCPHRYAPLSAGRVGENGISCGYHGMSFDRRGVCVANPTQPGERLSPRAQVRAYPLVERHGVLWIWMGEADLADPSTIPAYDYYDAPGWSAETAYLHVSANYLLLVDNLLDLTHINFVHGDVLGSPDRAAGMISRTDITENGVVERWFSPDALPVPAWQGIVNAPWMSGNVDFWMDMYWEPGSNMMLDVGITPAGTDRSAGTGIMNMDCVTPETATSTHYFYGTALKASPGDQSTIAFWMRAEAYAFDQDKRMIEAVQRNMGEAWDILAMDPVINKGDRAALHARRTLGKLIAAQNETKGDASLALTA